MDGSVVVVDCDKEIWRQKKKEEKSVENKTNKIHIFHKVGQILTAPIPPALGTGSVLYLSEILPNIIAQSVDVTHNTEIRNFPAWTLHPKH